MNVYTRVSVLLVLPILMVVQETFILEPHVTHVAGELGGALEPLQVPVERLPSEGLRTAGGALKVSRFQPERNVEGSLGH